MRTDIKNFPKVTCDCGFVLAMQPEWLYEAGIGVMGIIQCPDCKSRLNDKLLKLAEEIDKP